MNDKAIFIVGAPRSGTTLLREILNRHSKIAICPETHYFTHFKKHLFFETILKPKKLNHLRVIDFWYNFINDNSNIIEKIVNRLDIKNIIDSLDNYSWFLDSQINNKEILENLPPIGKDYQRVFKGWLRLYGKQHNRPIVGEKTPIHVLYMEEIQKIFEDARFVHIIRNPYSTVASLKKMPWAEKDLKKLTKLWLKCTYIDTVNIKKYHRIKFESLLNNPKLYLKKLCNFLDIEFSIDLIQSYDDSNKYEEKGEYWKKFATKEISSKHVQSSKFDLTKTERTLIEKYVKSIR